MLNWCCETGFFDDIFSLLVWYFERTMYACKADARRELLCLIVRIGVRVVHVSCVCTTDYGIKSLPITTRYEV